MKKTFVETYKVSKTFKAPLDYVFGWCTDFREDDGKMTGSKSKRTFLERTDKRIVWAVEYKEKGKTKEGIRVVWLRSPDSWTLDTLFTFNGTDGFTPNSLAFSGGALYGTTSEGG